MPILVKKYKNNTTAIFYLLEKFGTSRGRNLIYLNCDISLKNNKLIILNSIFDKNGANILNEIPNKTLQQDFDIVKKLILIVKNILKNILLKIILKI